MNLKMVIVFLIVLTVTPLFAQETTPSEPQQTPEQQVVEPPPPVLTPEPIAVEERKPKKLPFRIGLLLYYSAGDEFQFDDLAVSNSTGSGTGSTTLNTDTAAGVGIEASQSDPNSWGFSTGLTYDFPREVNSQTITVNGFTGSAVATGSKTKIEFFTLYVNAIYRWEKFYIPFGLNYTLPIIKRAPTAEGTLDTDGGVGTQLGAGLSIKDNLAIELFVRTSALKATSKVDDTTIDYGTGAMSSFIIQGKFQF